MIDKELLAKMSPEEQAELHKMLVQYEEAHAREEAQGKFLHCAANHVLGGDFAQLAVKRTEPVLIYVYGLRQPDFQDLIHLHSPFGAPTAPQQYCQKI